MKKLCIITIVMLLFSCVAFSSAAASTTREREDNNSYTKANTIQLGNTIIGTIKNNADVDYYKIKTPADGKVSLVFKHKYNNDRYYSWRVHTYIFSDNELIELSNSFISSSDKESVDIPAIGAKSGGSYYVKIEYSTSYDGVEYQLQTSFTQTAFYEKERNDSYPTATDITLNNTYGGNINNSSDADYYKIAAPADGKISLAFKHKYNNDKYYSWRVYTYILSDGELVELSNSFISSSDKESVDIPAIGAKSGVSYYVKIGYSTSYDGVEYQLQTSFNIASPSSLKAASIKTTSLKLSWAKVSKATGYDLYSYNAKTGKYKKIATTTSNSYKVTGLKSGSANSFAVKAYKKVNGTTYFSNYSPLLKTATKPEAVQNLKVASPAKKTVKITFDKVNGAKGYVVYYAATRDGSFKKLGTTTKTTYTSKKIESGKTYYFKVRAYTKAGSESIYGGYSPIKGVRVK